MKEDGLNKPTPNYLKYSLFNPRSARSLKEDYPELLKIKELKSLSRHELLFVWYYACKASPFYNKENDRERVINSIKFSYGTSLSMAEKNRLIDGNFKEHIKLAIAKMRKYEPGPRIRAKKMIDNMLTNWEKLIDINVNDENQFTDKDGAVDWSKKKAYIDASAKVSESLPKIIVLAEGGFGVADDNSEIDDVIIHGGGSLIDKFHDQKEPD